MSLTKRDFSAIAAAIITAKHSAKLHDKTAQVALNDLTSMLADICAKGNPRFDRAKFLAAAQGTQS